MNKKASKQEELSSIAKVEVKTIQMSDSNYLAWASKWNVKILQVLLELIMFKRWM